MPDTPSPPAQNRRQAPRRTSSRAVTALGFAGAIGVLCLCSVRIYGLVMGVEFSPDTFKQRTFYYFEIPLVHLQVTPVWRDEDTTQLATHLRSTQLLPASKQDEPRWHFVSATRGEIPLTGDAKILCNYMEVRQDDDILWLQWTKDHPTIAAVFWPLVAEVARDHQYVFLPEMFERALLAERPDALQQEIDRLLATKYSELGTNQFALKDHTDAIDSYTKALRYLPNDTDALAGRADAYEAVGEKKPASEDREKVRQLTE